MSKMLFGCDGADRRLPNAGRLFDPSIVLRLLPFWLTRSKRATEDEVQADQSASKVQDTSPIPNNS